MKVLVTAANTRMAYVITKALLAKGIEVVVADFIPRSFSFYSRYVKNYFVYPSPYTEQKEFIAFLLKKVIELDCDVLLPIHEETFLIAKYSSKFEGKVKLAIPSYEQILAVHYKDRFVSLCESLNITVPKTRVLDDISESEEIIKNFRFPVILKPRQGGGNFGIEYVKEASEFTQCYKQCLEKYQLTPRRVLIQEFVDVGQKFSQSFVYDHGKMVASFGDIHLRDYPATGGSGTLRKSIHRPDLEKLGKKIMDHLGWHGVAECEFITEKNTGKPFIIEINPRIWGGINSAITAGLNIPWLLYCIAIGEIDKEESVTYLDSIKTRWFWADMRVFPYYFKKSPQKVKFVFEFCNIFSSKINCDDFDIKDPLPFFVWPAKKILSSLKHRSLSPPSYGINGEWE